ncbi:hypothetical protein HY636_01660 [Candidatus Woesearchaeota archaeon]|nr:hypothetical protein [Candidatus Woesearchaeota archaeon]
MKHKLTKIYQTLLKNYGQQGWWPITLDGKLKPEYHSNDYSYPKTEHQQLEIIFGAILTQNSCFN